jgi:hypothetical protein
MHPERDATPDDETVTTPGAFRPGEPGPALSRWAHLDIRAEIGRGTFGRVFLAFDQTLDREVALKLITLPDADPGVAATVLHEGRMLARVQHPNVVAVHGADEVGGQIGIWMELVRGRSLADVVRTDGPLGADEATLVGVSLCRALAAVHNAGLLHRDLKPGNVMRESGGRIVLMDFGAGRDLRRPIWPSDRAAAGTPVCMAPEVLVGQPATQASDIYSLASLLFFLVSGEYPVEGRTLSDIVLAHGMGRRRLLADCRPDLPERFVQVVERALSPDPRRRPPTAGALMHDLLATLPASHALSGERPRRTFGGALARRPDAAAVDAEREATAEDEPSAAGEARSAWSRLPAPLVKAAGALAAVWAFGSLMSMALNTTLGRSIGFSGETPLSWLVWGVRSLIAPAVLAVILLGTGVALVSVWRLATTLWGGLAARWARVRAAAASRLEASRLGNPNALAGLLLVLQVAALVAVWWRFGPLIVAVLTPVDLEPALAPLRPDNYAEHHVFRQSLTAIVLAMTVARRRQSPIERRAVVLGLMITALCLVLLEAPYRVLFQNEFERVSFESMRCYRIGEQRGEMLLHCPDAAAPRNRVVRQDDSRVRRLGIVESVFTPSGEKETR